MMLDYCASVRFLPRRFSNLAASWRQQASDAFTGWNEAGYATSTSTVKASYSCRIGLASNLAISNPIPFASVRFPPTRFCDSHKFVRLANSRIRRDP